MLTAEAIEVARGHFQMSFVFNQANGLPNYAGCIKRNEDPALLAGGIVCDYVDMHIEAAWRGYKLAVADTTWQLERFDASREITDGMVREWHEAVDRAIAGTATEQLRSVRQFDKVCWGITLRIAGATPIET